MTLKKALIWGGITLILIILSIIQPYSYNSAGYRVVVTQNDGRQFVQYKAGVYYQGWLAKYQDWPNKIILSYLDSSANPINPQIDANKVEIGPIGGMFNDGPSATFMGTAQFNLPVKEDEMIDMNNDHKTPENLISARLSTYLIEALNSSCQLMNSETHYSGGRAQMSQDYLEQMKNGIYIVRTMEDFQFDSIEKTNKRIYTNEIVKDSKGVSIRKASSIKAYGITVSDASIAKVIYSNQILERLKKKIDASTEASISKQELMTAEQKKLTAKAKGEQKLTEIEYIQRQEQTKQVVAAQTLVELAKQDLLKQDIALQASQKEAAKIKTLADAESYRKRTVMQADGALEQKLAAWKFERECAWKAFSQFQGSLVPMYQSGSGGSNTNAMNYMEIMGIKAMKDLNLDMSNKSGARTQ